MMNMQYSPRFRLRHSRPSAATRRTLRACGLGVRPRRRGTLAAAAASSGSCSSNSGRTSAPDGSARKAVVVGGGWAGFASALALAKAGADVTLLDASESPGGLSSAFATPGGQLVEPGVKGFWFQYSNIEALVRELGVPDPFTPFTRSSFYSPGGLQVESPIFQDLPRVPAPLGTFVHTAALFRDLPLADRLSAMPLLQPLLEHDVDEAAYRHYDAMSAYELFAGCGVTRRLYDAFLSPMLLVTLFAPPTQLSAAAALGALHYFALSQQAAFDVRWCRGPIGDRIFTPLVQRLQALGVNVLGGRRVQEVLPRAPAQHGSAVATHLGRPLAGRVVAKAAGGGNTEAFDADVVVLAAGVPALQQLTLRSPLLGAAQDLASCMALDCSDVLAVRLWLDRKVPLSTPSNVLAGFDEGVGGTLFQLDALQDAYAQDPARRVLEFDMYHAEPLLPLSDDAIIERMLHTYLPPALRGGAVEARALGVRDASVLRFRKAVTRFSPGSDAYLPGIATSLPNVFVAGDCVRQGPGTHGCKGLSQEKAFVTGLQAGNAAASFLGLAPAAQVLPVAPDEPQIAAAKDLLRTQRQLAQLARGGFAAALSAVTGGGRGSGSSSSTGSSGGSGGTTGVEQLREDEQLQQLLRSEVFEQLGEPEGTRQRAAAPAPSRIQHQS